MDIRETQEAAEHSTYLPPCKSPQGITLPEVTPESFNAASQHLKDNPNMLNDVLAKFQDQPEVLGNVMRSISQSKDDIMKTIPQDQQFVALQTKIMKEKSKSELLAMSKAAKKSMPRVEQITGVRVTQTNQAKRYVIKPKFPEGTIFEGGECVSITDDIVAFYSYSSTKKNARASSIFGQDVFGEVIFVRELDTALSSLTVEEFTRAFPK